MPQPIFTCMSVRDFPGVPLNLRDKDGNTTLHYAAMGGHLDLCKFLIERGVSPASRNSAGRSPYDVSENHHIVRQYLLPIMFQAESSGQGDPAPRVGGSAAVFAAAPVPVENNAMHAATSSLMMPPPAYVGGYQIARAPQSMPSPLPGYGDTGSAIFTPPLPIPGPLPANAGDAVSAVPHTTTSGGVAYDVTGPAARSLNASLSVADQLSMNKVQSIGVPGRGILSPPAQDASPKSDVSDSSSPRPGMNAYPVPAAPSPRSSFQPPAVVVPGAYPSGYIASSGPSPAAPLGAQGSAAPAPPPLPPMMMAIPTPVPTQTVPSWIPLPSSSSSSTRVIRPGILFAYILTNFGFFVNGGAFLYAVDGFGSSASDPNLQKKYGHTQDIKVTAPPPIFGVGAAAPAYNPYSVSSAYGGGVPLPTAAAPYAAPPPLPGVAPFGAPPQVQPSSFAAPMVAHPAIVASGATSSVAPGQLASYPRHPMAAAPVEVSVFDPIHDVSVVASSTSSALM
jgi:hypothetical protein